MKLQGSGPSAPKSLQSQNRPRPENRLSISRLDVVHGQLFIDVRRAADGWIAATLARCSTMKGHYRIRLTIGANKI
jgi:hypothetical protein